MRALITLGMVIDVEPDEIPAIAADMEENALKQMYLSFNRITNGEPLDPEMAEEVRERFQMYGVSYSVLHELELES